MSPEKRRREVQVPDTQLIEIYDDLANEDESIRLKAATSLLRNFSIPSKRNIDQQKTILQRLFRGLCSGRKAARLGFSVALTEFLSEVFSKYLDAKKVDPSEILDLLVSQSAVNGNTSGQEERDHYFGRLFGAEAIVESTILFSPDRDVKHWKRLLDIVCGVASEKPWLRQECGWLLYTSAGSLSQKFQSEILDALSSHDMFRTPEGVAIWLRLCRTLPEDMLRTSQWNFGHPLHPSAMSDLADIMRDAKPSSTTQSEILESQGKAVWSVNLHFAWGVVLDELYRDVLGSEMEDQTSEIQNFADFWLDVVELGLFAPKASTERKHWGLLLVAKVLAEAPTELIGKALSPTIIDCLQTQLSGASRYLQRSAEKAIRDLQSRVNREPTLATVCLKSILDEASALQFDNLTKTKTIEKLAYSENSRLQAEICELLEGLFREPSIGEDRGAVHARKVIADLLAATCLRTLRLDQQSWETRGIRREKLRNGRSTRLSSSDEDSLPTASKHNPFDDVTPAAGSRLVMATLTELAFFQEEEEERPPVALESRIYIRDRIKGCLDQALKTKVVGRALLRHTVAWIMSCQKKMKRKPVFDFDDKIKAIVHKAYQRLRKTPGGLWHHEASWELAPNKSDSDADSPKKDITHEASHNENYGTGPLDGVILLYHLALLQAYCGEPEAIGVIEDLNMYYDHLADEVQSKKGYDLLIELLLSFASKQSKLLRRISLQAFESFASQITLGTLQHLIQVLQTKEDLQGQEDLFEPEVADEFDGEDSDDQMAGSDVEMLEDVSGEAGLSTEQANSRTSEEDENADTDADADDDDDDDEELAAFDAKLAAALGTRKGEDDIGASDSSDSDEDMSDSQMEALDEKIAEVFRARKDIASRPKKKEHKSARENIVNLKNRALDMIDTYLKLECSNELSLQLVMPLLTLVRTTNTKQLADRACTILREYGKRCKGTQMPQMVDDSPTMGFLPLLRFLESIHDEARRKGSKTYSVACSSASLLLARIIVHGKGTAGVSYVVNVYGATKASWMGSKKCYVQPSFFTDFNNWCVSARNSLAK